MNLKRGQVKRPSKDLVNRSKWNEDDELRHVYHKISSDPAPPIHQLVIIYNDNLDKKWFEKFFSLTNLYLHLLPLYLTSLQLLFTDLLMDFLPSFLRVTGNMLQQIPVQLLAYVLACLYICKREFFKLISWSSAANDASLTNEQDTNKKIHENINIKKIKKQLWQGWLVVFAKEVQKEKKYNIPNSRSAKKWSIIEVDARFQFLLTFYSAHVPLCCSLLEPRAVITVVNVQKLPLQVLVYQTNVSCNG